MKKNSLPRVIYCGAEDTYFKKLQKNAADFVVEARVNTFSGSPQKFARAKKAAVLILKIRRDFELKHQEWLSRNDASIPLIVISGDERIQTAIHALQYGIFDYFAASQSVDVVIKRIQDAIAWKTAKPIRRSLQITEPLLIGDHPQILQLNQQARTLAHEGNPLLLHGEAGTGKEHLAYGIYRLSYKKLLPFMRYDCRLLQRVARYETRTSSVPQVLRQRLSDFNKKAVKGVLFLSHIEQLNGDQIGEIMEAADGTSFRVIGSYQLPQHTGEEELKPTVTTLKIPALRERKEDIPVLAEYFIRRIASDRRERQKLLTREAIALMQEYLWPGNIQELANTIERIMMIEPSNVISAHSWRVSQGFGMHLNLSGTGQLSELIENVLKTSEMEWEKGKVHEQYLRKMESILINLVLPRVDHNQATAAKILGISRNTLREKIHKS